MGNVRKAMIRERAETLVSHIDVLLGILAAKIRTRPTSLADDAQWQEIVAESQNCNDCLPASS